MRRLLLILLFFICSISFAEAINEFAYPIADTNGKVWVSYPLNGLNYTMIDEWYDSTNSDWVHTSALPNRLQTFTLGKPPMLGTYSVGNVFILMKIDTNGNSISASSLIVTVRSVQNAVLYNQTLSVPAGAPQSFTAYITSIPYSKLPLTLSFSTNTSCEISSLNDTCRVRVFSVGVQYLNVVTNYLTL